METLTLLIPFLIIPCIMTGIGIAIYRYYDKKDQSFENSIPVDEWYRNQITESRKLFYKQNQAMRKYIPGYFRINEI